MAILKIKLSIPGFENRLNLAQFLGNSENRYQNCQFYVNDSSIEDVDYWFVFEDLQVPKESVIINPDNIYFLSAEVVHSKGYYDTQDKINFLNQFAEIFTCHDIFRNNATYDIPFLGWMINANHGPSIFGETNRDVNWLANLSSLEKRNKVSVFCSNKILTADHQLRYKFVKILKEHFGDMLDWYGNGIQSIPQKWDGIAPYKYHIVLENQSRHNIITEKIYDSYLGLAYPIYWGAPNLDDYFAKESFTKIEILDWRNAIKTIEQVFLRDEWEHTLPALIHSKNKVLTSYNPYHRIARIANSSIKKNRSKEHVELFNIQTIQNNLKGGFTSQLINKSGRVLQRLGNELIKITQA
jgi:hypothetical protein